MKNWEPYKLKDLVDLKQGFALNKKSDHYLSGDSTGYPLLKISDLINNIESLFVKENIPKQFLVTPSEIIYSRTGQVGLAFMGKTGVVYNNCFKVIPREKVHSVFLYHWLNTPSVRDYIRALATGTAQPDLNHDAFKSVSILLPPLETQTKIANILSAYDVLIENNLKRIKLLEDMAKITYEEWFLNRKIDGELVTDDKIRYVLLQEIITDYMNGGWGKEDAEASYSEQAFVIRGTDIPDIRSGNFTSIPLRYHTPSNLKSRVLQHGDILMEMSNGNMANVGRSLYFDDGIQSMLKMPTMCASFCKMFRPQSIGLSYLIDSHIKYIHNNNQMIVYKSQAANGINNFQFDNMIAEETINIPTDSAMQNKLFSSFESIYKTTSVLRKENVRLKEARDILLPRLMTGVIDVETLMKDAA